MTGVRKRAPVLLMTLMLLLPLLSGCWDSKALDQRAFAVMTGIDKTPDGAFRVSLQIQTAGLTGEKKEPGQAALAVKVRVAEGPTVQEAVDSIRGMLSRELDLTFLDIIVIGRAAAADLGEAESVVRCFRIPVSAFLAVTEGRAEDVVRATVEGFGIPGQATLFGFTGTWSDSARVIPGRIFIVLNRNLFTPLEDPHAPVLTSGEEGLKFNGMAVFSGRALAGFLSPEETTVVSLLLSNRTQRAIAVKLSNIPGAWVSYAIRSGKVYRKVTWEQDRPVIHINVRLRGDTPETIGFHLVTPADEKAAEAAIARSVAQEITLVMKHLQDLGADPMGFGELARQAAPYRREVSSGRAWHAAYQNARLDVRASATIISTDYMK